MIAILIAASALAGEVEVGASLRYSTMIDNLVGITLVNERQSLRPAGGQVSVEHCGDPMCFGGALELFPVGGHASLVVATLERLVVLGPVTAKPGVGLGAAYYGRNSMVPVIAGRNTSVVLRAHAAFRYDMAAPVRPVVNISWDTHPLLPALTMRRAHDLRVGLGVSWSFPDSGR